jgi:hypothetical protein
MVFGAREDTARDATRARRRKTGTMTRLLGQEEEYKGAAGSEAYENTVWRGTKEAAAQREKSAAAKEAYKGATAQDGYKDTASGP